MVRPKGYPLEEHDVTTRDGYILRTFRIPHGRHENASEASTTIRPPVLLLHGVSLSSTCWVVNEPSESLAFILADAGEVFHGLLGSGEQCYISYSCKYVLHFFYL